MPTRPKIQTQNKTKVQTKTQPAILTLTPTRLREAAVHLSAADKTLATIIERVGPLSMRQKKPPFHVLSVSIINQQLSVIAAAAIENRVAIIVPPPFAADNMLKAPAAKLRAAGLSYRKIEYLHALATRVNQGIIPLNKFPRMLDDEVVSCLVTAPGIGQWTAEMFLMFALHRADVVSLGDAALCRAANILYSRRLRGTDAEILQKASKKWQPYRAVACRYLWKSLNLTDKDSKK